MHQGTAFRDRGADLAGRPFSSHLPEQCMSIASGAIAVIDTVNPYPGQQGSFTAGHDILLVSGDVWISIAALENLFLLISRNPVRALIVNSGGDDSPDGKQQEVPLAVYLPAEEARVLLGPDSKSVFTDSLANLFSRLGDCDVVEGESLDPALPPRQVKNMLDLAVLEREILYQRACAALLRGTRIRDPNRIAIRGDLQCGDGVEIDLDVIIEGKVILGERVKIGANSILISSTIGANTRVNPFSVVEGSVIGANSFVGPYGRVRPGSSIGDFAQIGNFVEIKNSEVGAGARINHLAFIGDARLERNVTIGAGTITCNHDGVGVSRTEIRAGAYVGSGCKLVAPLSIGENATIGAGSTITDDVPEGKLVVARSRQVTVENWLRPGKKLAD